MYEGKAQVSQLRSKHSKTYTSHIIHLLVQIVSGIGVFFRHLCVLICCEICKLFEYFLEIRCNDKLVFIYSSILFISEDKSKYFSKKFATR